ncbi:POK9 protein, partial [Nothocercus nigrocapillus]|nr:POK9 protein [Nothocercus nigrocapillus]
RGSVSLDLVSAVNVTLTDNRPVAVTTTFRRPLIINGKACGALLLGRSSSTIKGLVVLPGLIDADYTGVIQIIVQTMSPPIFMPEGSRIAQMEPILSLVEDLAYGQLTRGEAAFGSIGPGAFFSMPMDRRPLVHAHFSNGSDTFRSPALLDTGADLTIVA